MFNNQREGGVATGVNTETFIGPSVKLEGTFTGEGDMVVEGMLVGTIATKGDIRVGTNALIEADITATNATIAGKVKGNVTVHAALKLLATAHVGGDIKAASLSVESGAVINGKLQMTKEKVAKEFVRSEVADKQKIAHSELETA